MLTSIDTVSVLLMYNGGTLHLRPLVALHISLSLKTFFKVHVDGVHYHYTIIHQPHKSSAPAWTCEAMLPVKEVTSGGKLSDILGKETSTVC